MITHLIQSVIIYVETVSSMKYMLTPWFLSCEVSIKLESYPEDTTQVIIQFDVEFMPCSVRIVFQRILAQLQFSRMVMLPLAIHQRPT